MRKKIRAPGFVVLAFLTVLTVIFWIGFDVYRTLTDDPDPVVPSEILEPLNPTLDQTALNRLQERMYLDDSEIGDVVLFQPPEPTTTPTPEVTVTIAPTPTITTESGSLIDTTITETEGGGL